jgi:transcriptional regulator with XRE-family HTH domain
MTKVDLAKRAGIHRVTLAKLESGESIATPETVVKLARALGVTPAALYGEEG